MKASRTSSINEYFRPKSGKLKSQSNVKLSTSLLSAKKIEEQIRSEVQKTEKVLQQITNTQNNIQPAKNLLDQFRKLEQQIRRKDIQIKEAQKVIKQIQNGYSYHSQKQLKMQNIVHFEINQKLSQIKKLKYLLDQKNDKMLHKKQKIKILISESRKKSSQSKSQIPSFEEFKQKYFKRSRQYKKNNENDPITIAQTQSKRRVGSNKQKREGSKEKQAQYQNLGDNVKMRDILVRKNVAETALKTATKKHLLEMSNYRSKLQFLKDQNDQLQSKLTSKLEQLKIAESKFCQSRSKSKSKNNISSRKFKIHSDQ